ncbi:MAG: hypothetical protein E7195_02785 [Peptococcaceae bacterium]|nr:hypothetical protein [Peptococcaceae bacterium]
MKKKLVTGALLAAFGAVALTGGTLAYFTDTVKKENVFTVGNVDIELTEPNWDASGSEDAPEVYPGERLAKDPTVENIGKNPCFVRVSVTNLDQFVAKYGEDAMIDLRTDYVDGKLGEGWEKYGDYYYYTKPLVVAGTEGESWNEGLVSKTDALFDQIVIPTEITNNADAKDIVVTAQAVQAQGAKEPNWAAVKTMTVAEIAAWFTTCGF